MQKRERCKSRAAEYRQLDAVFGIMLSSGSNADQRNEGSCTDRKTQR